MCLAENEGERLIDPEVGTAGVAGGGSAANARGGGGRDDDVELRPRRMDRLDNEVFRFLGACLKSENEAVRRAVCAIASW